MTDQIAPMIGFTEVKRNSAGQRRFVCHFYNLLTAKEKSFCRYGINQAADGYALAATRARAIGGKRMTGSANTNLIVFADPVLIALDELIAEILKESEK